MDDLITWLRAQLDWREPPVPGEQFLPPSQEVRHLRSARLILDEHAVEMDFAWARCKTCAEYDRWDGYEGVSAPCRTVRLLALSFSDRPGYLEEWRP